MLWLWQKPLTALFCDCFAGVPIRAKSLLICPKRINKNRLYITKCLWEILKKFKIGYWRIFACVLVYFSLQGNSTLAKNLAKQTKLCGLSQNFKFFEKKISEGKERQNSRCKEGIFYTVWKKFFGMNECQRNCGSGSATKIQGCRVLNVPINLIGWDEWFMVNLDPLWVWE